LLSNVSAVSNGVEGTNFIPPRYGAAGFAVNPNGFFDFQVRAHLGLLQVMNRDQLEQWRQLYFGNDDTLNNQINNDDFIHLRCTWWEACGGNGENPPDYRQLLLNQPPANPPVVVQATDLQVEVIHSPMDSKLLVLAPPGTGKTHTVVQRLLHIAANRGGDLENVLVVSFSRAAASELLLRVSKEMAVRRFGGNRPDIRTLDSLSGMGVQGQGNYEATIKEFRKSLAWENHPQYLESFINSRLPLIEHLIVDEIQDTTGERAELVLCLARRLASFNQSQGRPFGLLLLGDLRQSIHDFMLKGDSRSSFWMVRQFREFFPAMKRISFIREYRFEGNPDMRKLTPRLRDAMDSGGAPAGSYEEGEHPDAAKLGELLGELEEIPTREALINKYREVCGSSQSMAILARSNQRVRLLESYLHGDRQAHTFNLRTVFSSQGAGYPGWVGMLLKGQGPLSIEDNPANRDHFRAVFTQRLKVSGVDRGVLPSADQALDWLRAAFRFGRPVGQADLIKMMERQRDEPNELRPPVGPGQIWISVVHQAKGREFDVVVLDGDGLVSPPGNGDQWQEMCRISYVAATRAKRSLLQHQGNSINGFDWSGKGSAIATWIQAPEWAKFEMNDFWQLWIDEKPLSLQWNAMKGCMRFLCNGSFLDMEENSSRELCDYLSRIRGNYQSCIWKVRILDLRARIGPGVGMYLTPILSADINPQ